MDYRVRELRSLMLKSQRMSENACALSQVSLEHYSSRNKNYNQLKGVIRSFSASGYGYTLAQEDFHDSSRAIFEFVKKSFEYSGKTSVKLGSFLYRLLSNTARFRHEVKQNEKTLRGYYQNGYETCHDYRGFKKSLFFSFEGKPLRDIDEVSEAVRKSVDSLEKTALDLGTGITSEIVSLLRSVKEPNEENIKSVYEQLLKIWNKYAKYSNLDHTKEGVVQTPDLIGGVCFQYAFNESTNSNEVNYLKSINSFHFKAIETGRVESSTPFTNITVDSLLSLNKSFSKIVYLYDKFFSFSNQVNKTLLGLMKNFPSKFSKSQDYELTAEYARGINNLTLMSLNILTSHSEYIEELAFNTSDLLSSIIDEGDWE